MTCINTGRLKDAELLLQTLPLSQLYQDLQKLQKVTSDVIQPHVLSQLSRSLSLLQTKQQQLCTHLKTSATAYENMESSLSSKAKAISDHFAKINPCLVICKMVSVQGFMLDWML